MRSFADPSEQRSVDTMHGDRLFSVLTGILSM